MTLYHCSPTPGLKTLRPGVTKYFGKPEKVCLTASLPMALAARESMEEQAEHKGGTP